MFRFLIGFFLIASAYANSCDDYFQKRGESLATTNQAIIACSNDSNKLSYLHFFKATYFGENKVQNLRKSFELAQSEIEKYGAMFSTNRYGNLEIEEQRNIALSYYLYGTAVAQYIELKGKIEAMKRMSDIKNSMATILKMNLSETFHYGAYRTLAIFYFKVPRIAGGSDEKSRQYFEKLMAASVSDQVSSYPVNHLFYAQYLFENRQKRKACSELDKIINLDKLTIEQDFSDLYYETLKDQEDSKRLYRRYSC